jgi:hypothetical protein
LDCLNTVACFSNNSDVGFILQDAPKPAPNQGVIVDQ